MTERARSRIVAVVISLAALSGCATLFAQPAPAEVIVSVDSTATLITSRLEVGVTHAKQSLDPEGDPQAIGRARELLKAAAVYQNQHIMGFGADNPWPDPGVQSPSKWRWESLDGRVRLMRETGAKIVLTLCCAPTWMVDPNWRGGTDWSKLETAPLQAHEDDFAHLCAEVARRYKDVAYFQVWNEFKGMWNPDAANWDFVRYTRLYNQVWTAVKTVRPDAKIGGPYLALEGSGASAALGFPAILETASPLTKRDQDVLAYWMRYKAGADFITVDRSVTATSDPLEYDEAARLKLTPLFGEVVRQVQRLPGYRGESVWMAEDYIWHQDESVRPSEAAQAAALASMLKHELEAGLSVSLRWSPEQQFQGGRPAPMNLNWFSSTLRADGGQPFLTYRVYRLFNEFFGPGTRILRASTNFEGVEALASSASVLLINKTDAATLVVLGPNRLRLAPYEVRLVPNTR